MTALALLVLLLVLLAAARTSGWRIPAISASIAAGAWAISCLLAPTSAAGSEGHAWAWAALVWAVVTLAAALGPERATKLSPQRLNSKPRDHAMSAEQVCRFHSRNAQGTFPNTGPSNRPAADGQRSPVEDRFDVVPVWVDDERCVIPGVVMRAKTRRAVVAAAGFDSRAVELVDGGSVGCGEGHMNRSGRGFPFPDPEISAALDGEPRPLRTLHYLHSERLEGLLVEVRLRLTSRTRRAKWSMRGSVTGSTRFLPLASCQPPQISDRHAIENLVASCFQIDGDPC